MKVSFKVKKTGKASKYSYVSKVNVTEEKQADAILSATQTSVKSITVTTNFDATDSEVKLTRDGKAVATETIQKSTDGKTITIPSSASLVEGTYVVAVGDLTKEVVCETSKVDSIEFLSDKAAVVETSPNKYGKATVGYRVLNQFGDDITKTTMLTINASVDPSLNASDHQITFNAPTADGFMLGRDIITCVLLDTNSGKNASATLTCDMKAYAKTLTFEGIYNKDGKTLTEDIDLDYDTFFMLFTAEDQYGQTFLNYKNVKESTDIYVTVVGGLTGADRVTGNTFTVVETDGKKYLGYPLTWNNSIKETVGVSAGTVNVQALSSGGASCTGTFEVTEGGRPVSITAIAPAIIPAGEKTEIPYTALDASGKEVTAYKYMKEIEISGSDDVKFERQADGSAKLYLNAAAAGASASVKTVKKNSRTPVTFTMRTKNNKISTLTIYVTENAKPVAIDGLRDVSTTFETGTQYVPIKLSNLKLEDQYGRVMSKEAVGAAARNTTSDSAYALKTVTAQIVGATDQTIIALSNSPQAIVSTGSAANASGTKYSVVSTAAFGLATLGNTAVADDDVLFYICKAGAKGFATVNISIDNSINASGANKADSLNSTDADVQFNVKDAQKVDKADVTVKTLYVPDLNKATNAASHAAIGAKYAQKVIVKANGVLLSNTAYTVEDTGDIELGTGMEDGTPVVTVYAEKTKADYDEFNRVNDRKETITKQITITLNGTGEKIVQDVELSCAAPKVTTFALKAGGDSEQVAASTVVSNSALWDNIDKIVDQYGVKATVVSQAGVNTDAIQFIYGDKVAMGDSTVKQSIVFTFIGVQDDDATVTNNGTNAAELTTGSKFSGVTVEMKAGSEVASVKLHI